MDKKDLIKQAKGIYTDQHLDMLSMAVDFASQKHANQKRLSGAPYITHPLAVASILIDWRLDIDSVLAGVLHDTIEDTGANLTEIETKFGKDVAFLVDGVTKVTKLRSGMRDIDTYMPKTSDNLSKLLIAVCSDLRVILIKLADRLHNLRTLEHLPSSKQKKIASETLNVFAPLADRLGIGRTRVEMEDISFSYLMPKKYQELNKVMKKRIGSSHKYFEKIRRDVTKSLKDEGIEFTMDGRIKSIYSLHKKLKRVESIDDVYDLLALRLIVNTKEDCYRALGVLHGLYQPMLRKIKDYISVPKPNGYQSLHTTVITPYEQIVEFQIRTEAMHAFAERGLAASFHYNDQKLTKNYLQRKSSKLPRNLRWISQLQEKVQTYLSEQTQDQIDLGIDLFKDRIFVYSPRGDIFDLPEGSTALDFAYLVHSDVGAHAQGAKINHKMKKLTSSLSNGDIVEIITSKNVKPTEGWLKTVQTEKAKQKIRSFLNRQN